MLVLLFVAVNVFYVAVLLCLYVQIFTRENFWVYS